MIRVMLGGKCGLAMKTKATGGLQSPVLTRDLTLSLLTVGVLPVANHQLDTAAVTA